MTAATLDPQTVEIVSATADVVRTHGLAITTRMYEMLFLEHPEVRVLFVGEPGEQEKRLADAILAYAENIDRIGELVPVVERIAARHVAKSVQPEHYAIVGDVLIRAMVEVLGGLDIDIVKPWQQAYGFLASVFIDAETELYGQQAAAV